MGYINRNIQYFLSVVAFITTKSYPSGGTQMALATRPSAARRKPEVLFRARREELRELAELSKQLSRSDVQETSLVIDGERRALPRTLFLVLRKLVDGLAKEGAVTVAPHGTEVTTQMAADLLGVSRPRLIQLLDEGRLRFRREGTHRRVPLDDVLTYRQERSKRFEKGMRALQAITDEETLEEAR
jgi:excisionase family DNA binding protein